VKNLDSCPICESTSLTFAFSARTTRKLDSREWTASTCANCGHQFLNPQPSWDELKPYYSESYEAYDIMHGASASDEEQLSLAKKSGMIRYIPVQTGLRVLDVGCGGGWFLRMCKALGARVQGVEPGQPAAEMTANQGIPVFHGTIEEYVEHSGSNAEYDVITANHVVEHVPNPVATLRAMKELLAPGGYIWIAVPNATYLVARLLKGRWNSSDLPYHLMHFSPASMLEAGHRAGLGARIQYTESRPEHVAASLSQLLRHRCFVPYRIAVESKAVKAASNWYARKLDRDRAGEGLITEFVPI
jgi:2-polyprenyl-3-methyl-5-hydroxy-6-metoxy-1,4-benzoquinol methylase